MTEIIFTIIIAIFCSFISYHIGKQDARKEICENSGGIFVQDKCYTNMVEKKLEFKND